MARAEPLCLEPPPYWPPAGGARAPVLSSRLRMQTTPYSTHTRRAPAARACARALAPQRPPSCHAHAPRAPRLAASSTCCARAAARRVHLFAPLTSDRSAQPRPSKRQREKPFLAQLRLQPIFCHSSFITLACACLLACAPRAYMQRQAILQPETNLRQPTAHSIWI